MHHTTFLQRALGLLVAASLALAGTACGSASSLPGAEGSHSTTAAAPDSESAAGPPHAGGQLIVGLATETNSFHPFLGQWSASSYNVANAVFDPLVAVDGKGIAHPYLAEAVQTTGDFRQWTITVRPDIVFHNGEPLDARAVKKNLDLGRISGITAQIFALIESVDVADERSVVVRMRQPWATFPATLALQAGYVAAPAMLDDPAGADAAPIGTGPFVFTERIRDNSVKTRKNDRYWRKGPTGAPLPYLDAVEFRVLPDGSSRRTALTAGDIDAMDVLTPNELLTQTTAARNGGVQLLTAKDSEVDETVLALNTAKEPFDDPLARQVLAYGIDQEKLSNTAYQGAFPGAWGMFEPGSPYYLSRDQIGYPKPDVAKAKQLADDYRARHGKGLAFTVLIPPDPEYLAIAQQVQAEASEFGVAIELQAIEQSTMVTRVIATGDYQAAGFVLWTSPTPDQAYVMIASKANPAGLSLNYTRLDDPEITAAMDEFRGAAEPAQRVAAMAEVQKRLARDNQMIFLVHTRGAWVYANRVHGARDATTFPGTDVVAFSRYPTTPFYASLWKDAAK